MRHETHPSLFGTAYHTSHRTFHTLHAAPSAPLSVCCKLCAPHTAHCAFCAPQPACSAHYTHARAHEHARHIARPALCTEQHTWRTLHTAHCTPRVLQTACCRLHIAHLVHGTLALFTAYFAQRSLHTTNFEVCTVPGTVHLTPTPCTTHCELCTLHSCKLFTLYT